MIVLSPIIAALLSQAFFYLSNTDRNIEVTNCPLGVTQLSSINVITLSALKSQRAKTDFSTIIRVQNTTLVIYHDYLQQLSTTLYRSQTYAVCTLTLTQFLMRDIIYLYFRRFANAMLSHIRTPDQKRILPFDRRSQNQVRSKVISKSTEVDFGNFFVWTTISKAMQSTREKRSTVVPEILCYFMISSLHKANVTVSYLDEQNLHYSHPHTLQSRL